MAENELCVLLSNVGVDKDEDFIAWRKESPGNQNVEVVSVNEAGSKLKEREPTKLTLILTKYVTIEKPGNPWSNFKETLEFPPLITLHFIFLVENPKIPLFLGIKEFFENLQFKTIEFDFKSSIAIDSNPYNLPPGTKNNGIRMNLCSTTTSVTIRGPDAPIIYLRNNDIKIFSLEEIKLLTNSYPVAIILYNVDPDVIKNKELKVYWGDNELMEETFYLKNCKFAKDSRTTQINLTQPVSPNAEKLPTHALLDKESTQPASSDDKTLIQSASPDDETLIQSASSNEKLPPTPVSLDCTIFYCCLGEECDV
jgi:hypothetical protein